MPDEKKIFPIILAGGSGTRLWPLSRDSRPKQFIKFFEENTLFQKTVNRFSDKIFHSPIIITNNQSRFTVQQQLSEISKNSSKIIIEPSPKNTAPASIVGIIYSKKIADDPYVLISPSDHLIENENLFNKLIRKSEEILPKDSLLLIGCKPTSPHTGYGWISAKTKKNKNFFKIDNFIEKPPIELAEKLFRANSSFWNTGIFFGKASTFINEFDHFASSILKDAEISFQKSTSDLDFLRLDETTWNNLPSVPIDIAVMEKSKKLFVTPFLGNWTDLGSWTAIMDNFEYNYKENVFEKNSTKIDSVNSFLYSTTEKIHLVGIGLKNIITIATEDAVLVVEKDKSEKVKNAIDILKEKKVAQVENSQNDYRPWGFFEILSKGKNFLVKKIVVYPKKRLSLQKHEFRSEHWVVVEGQARVILDNEIFNLSKNESTYVNTGVVHRLENTEDQNLTIIEVQTGSYLGEDDIIRIEDDFKR